MLTELKTDRSSHMHSLYLWAQRSCIALLHATILFFAHYAVCEYETIAVVVPSLRGDERR